MSVKWFGKRYPAPIYNDCPQEDTPAGTVCIHCEEPILGTDDGFFYANGPAAHRECYMRQITGSVAHQQRRCSCYGGSGHDESGLTRRQAAKAALDCWEGRR